MVPRRLLVGRLLAVVGNTASLSFLVQTDVLRFGYVGRSLLILSNLGGDDHHSFASSLVQYQFGVSFCTQFLRPKWSS
jgi:hypothetical protein